MSLRRCVPELRLGHTNANWICFVRARRNFSEPETSLAHTSPRRHPPRVLPIHRTLCPADHSRRSTTHADSFSLSRFQIRECAPRVHSRPVAFSSSYKSDVGAPRSVRIIDFRPSAFFRDALAGGSLATQISVERFRHPCRSFLCILIALCLSNTAETAPECPNPCSPLSAVRRTRSRTPPSARCQRLSNPS